MIVVADSSPLHYFIRLGHPDVLREIYVRVLVPRAVLVEMQYPDKPPGEHLAVKREVDAKWHSLLLR